MNLEHGHQVALVNWWALEANRRGLDARLLVAIPNQGRGGGWRQARRGAYMKAEGVRAGMPDLCLFIPVNQYHGLAIELKAPSKTARVYPAQNEMMGLLSDQGYLALVAWGWEDAMKQILLYLDGSK